MVIHNRHFGGAGPGPAEDDPPLIVDANGMKAAEISPQGFETISRRDTKVGKRARPVHLHELAQGDTGDGGEPPVFFLVEKLPGIGVGERLDHFRRSAKR